MGYKKLKDKKKGGEETCGNWSPSNHVKRKNFVHDWRTTWLEERVERDLVLSVDNHLLEERELWLIASTRPNVPEVVEYILVSRRLLVPELIARECEDVEWAAGIPLYESIQLHIVAYSVSSETCDVDDQRHCTIELGNLCLCPIQPGCIETLFVEIIYIFSVKWWKLFFNFEK